MVKDPDQEELVNAFFDYFVKTSGKNKLRCVTYKAITILPFLTVAFVPCSQASFTKERTEESHIVLLMFLKYDGHVCRKSAKRTLKIHHPDESIISLG